MGNELIDEVKSGDVLVHRHGYRYLYRGWVHGSDCHILSEVDGLNAYVVTPEQINTQYTREKACKECKRPL